MKKGQRDASLDALKGICIILIVYGHVYPACRNFIYLFHVPVFLCARVFYFMKTA